MDKFQKSYTLSKNKSDDLLKDIFEYCSNNALCFFVVNTTDERKDIYIFYTHTPFHIQVNLNQKVNNNFNKAKIITIIGPDGVGKTSLFTALRENIQDALVYKRFKKIVRRSIIYNFIYPFSKKILKSKLRFKPSKDQHDDCHPKLVFAAGLLYYPYLLFLAYIQKKIVFIDRYFNDYLLQNISFMDAQTRLRQNWQSYLYFLPSPLMTLHLDADEEIIHSRKNELSSNDIQEYRKLNFFLYQQKPSFLYTYINTQNDINFCKDVVLYSMQYLNQVKDNHAPTK